jgi:hypothetical protein
MIPKMARTRAAEKVFRWDAALTEATQHTILSHPKGGGAISWVTRGFAVFSFFFFSFVARLPRENGWVAPENGRQHRPGIFEAPFRESPESCADNHFC